MYGPPATSSPTSAMLGLLGSKAAENNNLMHDRLVYILYTENTGAVQNLSNFFRTEENVHPRQCKGLTIYLSKRSKRKKETLEIAGVLLTTPPFNGCSLQSCCRSRGCGRAPWAGHRWSPSWSSSPPPRGLPGLALPGDDGNHPRRMLPPRPRGFPPVASSPRRRWTRSG